MVLMVVPMPELLLVTFVIVFAWWLPCIEAKWVLDMGLVVVVAVVVVVVVAPPLPPTHIARNV